MVRSQRRKRKWNQSYEWVRWWLRRNVWLLFQTSHWSRHERSSPRNLSSCRQMPILSRSHLSSRTHWAFIDFLQEKTSAMSKMPSRFWTWRNKRPSSSSSMQKKPRRYGEMPVLLRRSWTLRSGLGGAFVKMQPNNKKSSDWVIDEKLIILKVIIKF